MRRFWVWLCIFALALRLFTLGRSLLWYDEAFTVALVRQPLLNMLAAIRGDVHPPLWYLIEWVAYRVGGDNAIAMRLPAAFAGTAGVFQMYRFVKGIAPEKAAKWSAVLMAVMPGQLYYSQEARMYSLLTLLVLMGAHAITQKNWLRLGLVLPLILYTQATGITYVIILAVWGLVSGGLPAFKRLAVGGLGYAPWLLVLVGQLKQIDHGFWVSQRASVGAPIYMLSFTTVFTRLPEQFYIHGIALAIILTLVALMFLWGKLRTFAPILILTFGPPALLYVISLIWRPVLLDRALLPSGAMLLAIWGTGLSRLTGWPRRAMAVVGLPLMMVAFITFYTDPTGQRPATDPITETIRENWEPGDAMYHVTLESAIAYGYYLPGWPAYVLPEAGDLAQSLTDETKAAIGLREKERLFSNLRQMGYKRAWLFIVTNPVTSDYEVSQAKYITDNWPTIRTWTFLDDPISSFKLAIIDLASPTAYGKSDRVTDQ